jgi:hypothetical protein
MPKIYGNTEILGGTGGDITLLIKNESNFEIRC